jgi:hypothetical protein
MEQPASRTQLEEEGCTDMVRKLTGRAAFSKPALKTPFAPDLIAFSSLPSQAAHGTIPTFAVSSLAAPVFEKCCD